MDRTPRGPAIVVNEAAGPPLDPTYWDLDRRVRMMNRQGVKLHGPIAHGADDVLGGASGRFSMSRLDARSASGSGSWPHSGHSAATGSTRVSPSGSARPDHWFGKLSQRASRSIEVHGFLGI